MQEERKTKLERLIAAKLIGPDVSAPGLVKALEYVSEEEVDELIAISLKLITYGDPDPVPPINESNLSEAMLRTRRERKKKKKK